MDQEIQNARVFKHTEYGKEPMDFSEIKEGDVWEYVNKPDYGIEKYRALTDARIDTGLNTYVCSVTPEN